MHRTDRRVLGLVLGLVLALAVPPVVVAAPSRPGKERPGGGSRPDPRCRSIENRLDAAKDQLKGDQADHRKAKQKVNAARKSYDDATGERAKNRAKKKLNRAKKAAKRAKADVEDSKDKVADIEQDAERFDCAA